MTATVADAERAVQEAQANLAAAASAQAQADRDANPLSLLDVVEQLGHDFYAGDQRNDFLAKIARLREDAEPAAASEPEPADPAATS